MLPGSVASLLGNNQKIRIPIKQNGERRILSADIALMSRELLNNHPTILNYTTIWMDTLRNGESELVNTNKLIRNYKGATGLKTGSTSVALYNLSASATRDNTVSYTHLDVYKRQERTNMDEEE